MHGAPRPLFAVLALLIAAASCTGVRPAASSAPPDAEPAAGPVIIATWPFGQVGTAAALERLAAGGSALDAVESGVRAVETLGPDGSVGLAGRPNAAGYVQLDACIMDGRDHRAGSVAAVEGIAHPITAARLVMERTPHVMLVGEGARWFALEHGLESVDVAAHDALKRAWRERPRDPDGLPGAGAGHDTIALLVRAADGSLAGGCSTSGAGRKLPGRVGDSPILGSGLYVDGAVGAAGATGLGENIMRHCASFLVVELMRQGRHPQDACEEVIHRMAERDPRGYALDACLIAIDRTGRVGAAASSQAFPFAVTTERGSEVRRVARVVPR